MASIFRIKSLSIREGFLASKFDFSERLTLVHSEGRNSVGKTTLLRCLLFALGEDAASTARLDFSKLELKIRVARDDGDLCCLRSGDMLKVYRPDGVCGVFSVANETDSIRKFIWGFDSRLVRENYLGAVFIDQDKGWTLFNRGKVTSGIPFNIEKFIDGLSGEPALRLSAKENSLDNKIKRYQTVMSVVDAKRDIACRQEGVDAPDLSSKRARLSSLQVERNALAKRLRSVKRAVKDNERFVQYVEDMGLRVKIGGEESVVIKRDNLVGWSDSMAYQEVELSILARDIAELDRQIDDVKINMAGDEALFNVVSSIDDVERRIAQLSVDGNAIVSTMDELKKERKSIRDRIKEVLSSGNEVFDFLSDTVYSLAQKMHVGECYLEDANGLLTRSVKKKSGTSRQLLVAAFRLGYAKAIEHFCGVRVPLIIDSPKNGEMSKENFELLVSLLQDEFSDWQIIVASIDAAGFHPDGEILIKQTLMENAEPITDIEAWEREE